MDSFSRTRLSQEIFVRVASQVVQSNSFSTWSDFAKRCIQIADSFEKADGDKTKNTDDNQSNTDCVYPL